MYPPRRTITVDLTGKNVLVTGGAKGIGEAICRALAANRSNLAINCNTSTERAKALVEEFHKDNVQAVAIQADVSNSDHAKRLISQAREALGGAIDILVNNAGTQLKLSTIEKMPVDLWRKVLDVNLTSAMLCSKYVISGMKKSGWGRIINISSISASSGGGPGAAHYASAKAGMSNLTRALAKELGPCGITANAVAPGVIMTEQHEKFSTKQTLEQLKKITPLNRLGHPEDVAGTVLFLASDSASYITGETIAVNGGLRMD